MIVITSLALAGALPWLIPAPAAESGAVVASGACMAVLAWALRALGWLGGAASVRRAAWAADGSWRLEFADGTWIDGVLTDATRVLPPVVFLAFATARGRRYLFLTGSRRSATFRRLIARLMLEHHESRTAAARLPGGA